MTKRAALKGLDAEFKCREFQFDVGRTYTTTGAITACKNGFHSCPDEPFAVWKFYPPCDGRGGLTRYADVDVGGEIDVDGDKIASAVITIKTELTLPAFVKRGVEYILSKVNWAETPPTNTGDRSAATNTGHWSAATNTGHWSAATNTGDRSAASVTGKNSIAVAWGDAAKAKAALGSALVLPEWDNVCNLKAVHSAIAGITPGIKPDTFYEVKDGALVEWTPS